MKFSRDEIIGIIVSIAVATAFFAAMHYDVATRIGDLFAGKDPATLEEESSVDTVVIAAPQDAVDVLRDAFSRGGKIEKLIIQDTEVGEGAEVVQGSRVRVHYVGMLQDGTVFDNSYEKGEPYPVTVGMGDVIRGWDEGLLGMKQGGERILVIPADLAYGNRTMGPIPANSTLLFSVELISVE
jgi:hypothetical protein